MSFKSSSSFFKYYLLALNTSYDVLRQLVQSYTEAENNSQANLKSMWNTHDYHCCLQSDNLIDKSWKFFEFCSAEQLPFSTDVPKTGFNLTAREQDCKSDTVGNCR